MSEDELKSLLKDIALNDDRMSLKKVYIHYYKRLILLATTFVKSGEVAEEIVDDVFLNVWSQRLNLPQINNFTNYLYTCVKNKSLNHLSKSKVIDMLDIEEMSLLNIGDPSPSGEEYLYLAETTIAINKAVSQLPRQCQLVFRLVKEDGQKYKEVAELLNITVKTVEYHMSNALKHIALSIAKPPVPFIKSSFKKIFPN